ncbi:helix-turn-helix transcriptional regulator [Actinoplanes sp. L3-i22]|uniref:AraC family transcriptional regulator n=1 Tax=Actinoplanes sp. L3-i22 TaxID=2836373 RepID=UPI001C74A821|nr:helix-turn-helix transcriptional regulator [Actinoplanes sp. L3-i22]BCY11186.1 putative transcriptional regulator, AraC family protein [Actinoplanes sp. L3-i22]
MLTGPTIRPLGHRERIEWHDHAVHQLVHPLRGVLQVHTGRGVWIVPPNRAVWLPAEVPHAHQANGPTEMRSLIFGVTTAAVLTEPTVLVVGPLLREVIRTLSEDRDLTAGHRHHLEQVALHQLRRAEALPLMLPAPSDPRLVALCDLLAADPADQRSLHELGRQVGAAERTLSRLFRAETGFTFPQWRAQLRLHHALSLLTAGRPVTRVAVDCGFRSPSAFIEAFRALFGTTPGRYLHS